MERRTFLTSAAVPLVAGIAGKLSAQTPAAPRTRIKQSVMASVWTGSTASFEERCKILARIGFKGVDAGRMYETLYTKHNIVTARVEMPGQYDGLRVTPHIYSTLRDVDTFAETVEREVMWSPMPVRMAEGSPPLGVISPCRPGFWPVLM